MNECACGSAKELDECCRPLISRGREAGTAEELMRSRYCAYVLGEIDYITETHDPKRRDDHDPEQARKWSEESEWLGLQILSTEAGGPDDESGQVEFIARFRVEGEEHEHRERSLFVKRGGRWYFRDGKVLGPLPIRNEGPRVGRNDPCPCGSGKKYKKCCGP